MTRRGKPRGLLFTFVLNLAIAVVVLSLVQAFVVKLYWVPSGSMSETLQVGDRILVSRVDYAVRSPEAGEVVVFTASEGWGERPSPADSPLESATRWLGGVTGLGPSLDHTLVKRVIGVPGQSVACCDALGRITVDGVALDEPYVTNDLPFVTGALDCDSTPVSSRCFETIRVPEAGYLVLGDNRGGSSDSVSDCRGSATGADCARFAERDQLVGRAFVVAWPFARWRGL